MINQGMAPRATQGAPGALPGLTATAIAEEKAAADAKTAAEEAQSELIAANAKAEASEQRLGPGARAAGAAGDPAGAVVPRGGGPA